MAENPHPSLEELSKRLEELRLRHDAFHKEIRALQAQIAELKMNQPGTASAKPASQSTVSQPPAAKRMPQTPPPVNAPQSTAPPPKAVPPVPKKKAPLQSPPPKANKAPKESSRNLESFIGGNLINKVGIAITVIGVGIGAKYSIDNGLISPMMRILLGYLLGLGLLGFAYRFRQKYTAYSAVLLGGAMAIMYFLTYMAFAYYDLFPQGLAFALMVLFTAFTVLSALQYNMQIIAHLGLVGAYGVPFLLSTGSGRIEILFSYMALVNAGIMVLAFKKSWRPLLYVSFGLTWVIYASWFTFQFDAADQLWFALGFSTLFFALFYVSFIAHVISKRSAFGVGDIAPILLNSLFYYALGYGALNHVNTEMYLGLFTALNAVLHFVVGLYLYRSPSADKNAFFLVIGLVLVFLTIAIPVQLDGRWVTLLWASEAAMLFWLGRTKDVRIYEQLSYPVMVLASLSLWQDWSIAYEQPKSFMTVVNMHFLTTLFFCTAFALIAVINERSIVAAKKSILETRQVLAFVMPILVILTLYAGLMLELDHYFQVWSLETAVLVPAHNGLPQFTRLDESIPMYQSLWALNFTFVFLRLLYQFNLAFLKRPWMNQALAGVFLLASFAFLSIGLFQISELRELYLHPDPEAYFTRTDMMISIRYMSILFFAMAVLTLRSLFREPSIRAATKHVQDLLLHTAILWLLSSELLHWMDIAGHANNYKLGLSILWGSYALLALGFGIWKHKKVLRYGTLALFGITLVKLFFYDIAHLGTLSKTVVFVSLGVLMLAASYLYNRYKNLIHEGEPTDEDHE